jgi:hypothetical protein
VLLEVIEQIIVFGIIVIMLVNDESEIIFELESMKYIDIVGLLE